MHRLEAVILPDAHSIVECWNPHFHGSPFKNSSARLLRAWYAKEHPRVKRVAPLCIFGGVSYSCYVLREQAESTYAVCSSCQHIMMCGYNNAGIGPKKCLACRDTLGFNDYFQPISKGSRTQERDLVDPQCDPAVTMAEVCALYPDGIPVERFATIIVILIEEKLLKSGNFIDGAVIDDNKVQIPSVHNRLAGWPTHWVYVDSDASLFNVKVSDHGSTMLKARGIHTSPQAASRVRELVVVDQKRLQALGCKALVNQMGV